MVLLKKIGIVAILMAASNTVLAIDEIIVIGKKGGLTMAQQMELREFRDLMMNNHNVGIVEDFRELTLFLGPPKCTCDSPETIEECADSCKSTVLTAVAAGIDITTLIPVNGSMLSTFMELSLVQGTNAVQAGSSNYIDSKVK